MREKKPLNEYERENVQELIIWIFEENLKGTQSNNAEYKILNKSFENARMYAHLSHIMFDIMFIRYHLLHR